MNTPLKLVLVALLVGAAGVVWVPDVRNAISGQAPEETTDFPQDPIPGMDLPLPVPVSQGNGENTPAETQAPKVEDPTQDPALRNFASKRGSFLMGGPKGPSAKAPEESEEVTTRRRLRLWLTENPLTAVMQSSKGNRAIFGGAIYAEGQVTSGGWTVLAIEADRVEIVRKDWQYTVHLPRLGEGMQPRAATDDYFDRSPKPDESEVQTATQPQELP
ncbi:MAG: hypothetical protein KDB61_08010 [Planctomycetes bacterium]|nr:hypothetical protein [Planctomycetota bacterium]